MAKAKRTKAQREEDLAEVAVLLSKGATEREIALHFDISPSTAHRDVEEVEERWQERAAAAIDAHKARLIATHERVAREAWDEWDRSKQDGQKLVETTELIEVPVEDEDGLAKTTTAQARILETVKRVMTTEGQTGDPRYLQVIESALAEQAKLIGANAPVRRELTGKGGSPLTIERTLNLTALSDQELALLDELVDKAVADGG